MHKAFPLPVIEFPLPEEVSTASEESYHCQKKREATAVKIALLLKSRRNCQSKSNDSYAKIQQYLQHEHYALWEVIKFGDSYEVPTTTTSAATTGTASDETGKKKGRTVTVSADDMQKKKNDVKARTTLLLSLPDEHQLQFKIEHDDLNQKFLTSLAPEWLMHTIVWRNRSDLDTISLDDLYNHLKIDEDDMEEMDIKWNMALLSMRANKFWGKISIQGIDMAGFDKFKDWSYMANEEENHALVAEKEAPTEFALMANTSAESKVLDNSLCSKDGKKNTDSLNSKITDLTDKLFDAKNMIYHYKLGLAQVESRLAKHRDREIKYCEKIKGHEYKTEFSDDYIEILKKELELIKKEKEGLDRKLTCFQTASKDLDSLLESQRLDKNKEGLGYSVVPPSPAQIYSSPKKDMSWTGLPEFKDDTVTDYSRPAPTVESSPDDAQNKNPSVTETEASPSTISPKSFIKFVNANDSPTNSKTDKAETAKKSPVNKRVKNRTSRSQNTTHKSFTPRPDVYRPPMRPMRSNMNGAWPNRTSFNKPAHSYTNRPFQRTSAVRSQYRAPWVLTVNKNFPSVNRKFSTISIKFPTANRKFSTGDTKFSTADMGKKGKAVKPSACWFWKPLQNLSIKGQNSNSVSVMFKKYTYIDTQGKLKTPRQHNMYSIDLNNIVPHKDLTCLVAKASADECMLWHKRLGIKREFSNARTPQRNGVAKRRNGTLIEAARTMLADAKLPVTFWAEAVNTACYVQNRTTEESLRQKGMKVTLLDTLCLAKHLSKPQDDCITDVPESSRNSNPTATLTNPPADQLETLTVETPIPTISSPVPTACLNDSLEPSNRFEDILRVTTNSVDSDGVEADISNMETTITAKPKKISDALQDPSWVEAMQEELLQFKIQNVWTFVDCPKGDPEFPAKVYKVEKAMYVLHQAPRACYGTLSKYLLTNGFQRGTIDQTLFIRRQKGDFILVQVYVDDIIFGSSNPQLCREFEALMHENFQMSAMGELNFFLGLQVLQKEDGIFLSQDKYIGDILKKFGYSDVRSSNTPMDKENPWGKDETGKDVDLHLYRSMIGSLMYLTASRLDIMFAACAYARHQVTPKECHLHAVKRIFRYLKGHPKLGLWYPKESLFDFVAYSDSDYGGATQDRKSTTGGECVAAASCCGQVLWIQNQLLDYGLSMPCVALSKEISSSILRFNTIMARLQFCDYYNMVAVLEKSEHNVDFHPIVDFVEASPLRIETMEEGTKILATIDGVLRTVTESSLRRNLKLKDEEGISSLPDAELFENLTLMGYNISLNQKFTFQKGFNEFSSNIATALVCLATNRTYNFSKMIFDGMGEGSGTPTEPHHTPSPEAQQTSYTTHSSPTLPPVTTAPIPTVTTSDTPTLRQYTRRARISQSLALLPVADEPASPLRDVSEGEAYPTDFGFGADQDRANIAKTSTLPHDSAPRLQRQHSEMVAKFEAQELEINRLNARVKLLEDKEGEATERSRDDALIKGRNLDEGEAAAERVSDDTKEMATVLTSMDAATVLASGFAEVPTGSGSILTSGPPAAEVPTGSDVVPTAGPIFATATVVTPYTRKKGKETMVESETLKKKKIQEQMDIQMARQLEEEMERDA
nr:hypothetical protein [Tanacetum cinerariifolium]